MRGVVLSVLRSRADFEIEGLSETLISDDAGLQAVGALVDRCKGG